MPSGDADFGYCGPVVCKLGKVMVKQIGFFADELDESLFVAAVESEGAKFLPCSYPEWPLPVLKPPLPSPTEPYMGAVVIWHPEIFLEWEMQLEDNRPFNPAGRCFDAGLWPVLNFWRPHPVHRPTYWAILRLYASYSSFRFSWPLPKFTDQHRAEFSARAELLQKLYRRLCTWIRRRFTRLSRGTYYGPSVVTRLPELAKVTSKTTD
jgi:hypothetical protein